MVCAIAFGTIFQIYIEIDCDCMQYANWFHVFAFDFISDFFLHVVVVAAIAVFSML